MTGTRNWDTQLFPDIEEEDEIESIVLKSDARFAPSFRSGRATKTMGTNQWEKFGFGMRIDGLANLKTVF
ncbi:hypothetical protein Ddc_12894 [Ditylenchus destructor]|nr:hypothetical protein Ddc_12894 [Ditylenchus destructor]